MQAVAPVLDAKEKWCTRNAVCAADADIDGNVYASGRAWGD